MYLAVPSIPSRVSLSLFWSDEGGFTALQDNGRGVKDFDNLGHDGLEEAVEC